MPSKKAACLVALTLSSTALGWGFKDLDPFNRNSAVRAAGRRADPFHSQSTLREWLAKVDPSKAARSGADHALHAVGSQVGSNGEFRAKAKRDGWTTETCNAAGLGIAAMVAGFKAAPICASLIPEPISATTCISLVLASTTTVLGIACNQLCADHRLADC